MRFFFSLFMGLLIVSSIRADANTKLSDEKNFWFSFSIGPVFNLKHYPFLVDVSIEFSDESSIYSAQYNGLSSSTTYSPLRNSSSFDSFDAINFLYGKINRNKYYKFSYSAGLSFFIIPEEKIDGDVVMISKTYAIGLPFSVQFIFAPIPLIGIGLKAYANLNAINSFVGTSIGLYFGKVSNQ
jgi:hypothetical protein